jgi:hypothetical protein
MLITLKLIAACSYPELLETDCLPKDVKEKAKIILNACNGKSVGTERTHRKKSFHGQFKK